MSIDLVGSPRQVSWARQIISTLSREFPGEGLPDISSAAWWIQYRDASLGELWRLADNYQDTISTPFTATYPRYTHDDAVNALHQLVDFIVIDAETTGVNKQSEIVELAMVDFQSGEVLYDSLIQPHTIPTKWDESSAHKANGITLAELLDANPLTEEWNQILAVIQDRNLTSYNADFDMRMIRNSAWLNGLQAPPLTGTCLMKLATAWLELDYYPSLDDVMNYFGITNDARHRAAGDALATREVVLKMMEEL